METENYGLLNLIAKNWKINYVSAENVMKPLDKNIVSLIKINVSIDLLKVARLYQNE